MSYRVSIKRCEDYQIEHLRKGIESSLEPWGGMKTILDGKEMVLLKLNLLGSAPPEAAVTTHPSVVEVILSLIGETGVTPIIGDSPGGITSTSSYQRLLDVTGIARVAREMGCRTIFFDEDTMIYHSNQSRTFRQFRIPRILTEVDAVIGLSRFKTHQLTTITGAVKLLYGYIPGSLKAEYHLHTGKKIDTFAELLCDLYATFPPTLSLMDAVIAMEGNGPRHGVPRTLGLILSSPSAPALDWVIADIVGFKPLNIPTIQKAAERGMGPTSLEEIDIVGEELEMVRCDDFSPPDAHKLRYVPEFFLSAVQSVIAAYPAINPIRCRRCGICVQNCPSQAIRGRPRGVPSIRSSRCIRCFCCQELCPEGAVEVQLPALRRLLQKRRKEG